MNNIFYVYAYLDPRKPGKYAYDEYAFNYEPFYIGKGKGNRVADHLMANRIINRTNTHKNNKIKKLFRENLKPVIKIISNNMSEKDAFDLERNIIHSIGRHNKKTGPLTNHCEGGEGASGYVVSNKSRINICINSSKYWKNKKLPKQSIEKGKNSNKNQDRSHEYRTYILTSPDNQTYVVKNGLQNFADRHGLIRSKLVSVASGNRNSHHGWKCKIIDRKIFPRNKTYKLMNLITKEKIITNNIIDFCHKNNLDCRRLYEIARRKRYIHKGWTCKIMNQSGRHNIPTL